ncbi:hypothetical protein VE03_03886 [Pseudogymnoascus sp. 23342-1-I1]|nr:hypothetical protein VE03_03886 [Pseudogymnoascus sp. 23342-1-I1]
MPTQIITLYSSCLAFSILFCIYVIGLGLCRVYWSPLSKFPGPKLAAATLWYEFYYDVILGGQYTFKIRDLHAQYGPIIRINPYEIHVYTPEFYEELYSNKGKRRHKWYWATKAFAADESTFATALHEPHRMRRAALNAFFSKGQVRQLQPMIQSTVDKLLKRFKTFQETGDVMRLDVAFAAYSADVIMEYAFGKSEEKVNAADFDSAFHHACVGGGKSSFLVKQFPIVLSITNMLPKELLLRLNPSLTSFIRMHVDIGKQVKATLDQPTNTKPAPGTSSTIFQELLSSKLPPSEKTLRRLAQDGGAVVGAGTVTTAWAISVAMFYLLSQPETLKSLKDEIREHFPDADATPSLAQLEQLPYLSATIQEALRLSYGVATRLQRIAPDDAITFVDPGTGTAWVIPAGTPISMTALHIVNNEDVFPAAGVFRPERWIEQPRLDRFQVAFSRGSRICLGANLALAEIYLVLFGIFRVWGSEGCRAVGDRGVLELVGTDESDIICVRDAFVPLPKADTLGVRCRMKI